MKQSERYARSIRRYLVVDWQLVEVLQTASRTKTKRAIENNIWSFVRRENVVINLCDAKGNNDTV